jgi:hypothetical protein
MAADIGDVWPWEAASSQPTQKSEKAHKLQATQYHFCQVRVSEPSIATSKEYPVAGEHTDEVPQEVSQRNNAESRNEAYLSPAIHCPAQRGLQVSS